MKIRRGASSSILLLLPTASLILLATGSPQQSDSSIAPRQPAPEAALPGSAPTALSEIPHVAAVNIRTHDAPVDGKDGKPHAGPFVETAAERERKKAKGGGEGGRMSAGTKPLPKPMKVSQGGGSNSESSPIPESNDGVMDDPYRVSPEEGTRGTEGGISEKDRDRKAQESHIGGKAEKKPDPPKEAPPLPNGEEEKLAVKVGKETGKKGKRILRMRVTKSKLSAEWK